MSKNHWELNGTGLGIAGAFSGVREKIAENRDKRRAAGIANPRPVPASPWRPWSPRAS
jgi:hypothetical protein